MLAKQFVKGTFSCCISGSRHINYHLHSLLFTSWKAKIAVLTFHAPGGTLSSLSTDNNDDNCCINRKINFVCSGKKKTGPKKTALKFEYSGEDLTCLEQRLTQAEIDRVMGSDLLVRAVFHGQADVTALLEVILVSRLGKMPCMSM